MATWREIRQAGHERAEAMQNVGLELAELQAIQDAIGEGMQKLVHDGMLRIQADARARLKSQRGAYWTGRTYEAVSTKTFDGGDTGRVFVAWTYDAERFGGQKRPLNLPLWIEYGTINQPAKPFLIPAGERERAKFFEDARRLLEKATK